MQILWFGKRDVERLDLDLSALLSTLAPQILNLLLGSIGKRDIERLDLDLSALLSALAPQLLNFLLGSIGKRDVERVTPDYLYALLNAHSAFFSTNQFKQLVKQYAPLVEVKYNRKFFIF